MSGPCQSCGTLEGPGLRLKRESHKAPNGDYVLGGETHYCISCAERIGILTCKEADAIIAKTAKVAR